MKYFIGIKIMPGVFFYSQQMVLSNMTCLNNGGQVLKKDMEEIPQS